MDALSKEFVRLVKESGWTQREVARQLDLTEGAVSHVMTGRNKPSPTVVRLFRLVMGSDKETVKSGGERTRKSDAWEGELLKKLRALKLGQRKRVLEAVDAMVAVLKT